MGIGLSDERILFNILIKIFGEFAICFIDSTRNNKYKINRTLPLNFNDWKNIKKLYGKKIPIRYISYVYDGFEKFKEFNYLKLFSEIFGEDWYYDDNCLVRYDKTIVCITGKITFGELCKQIKSKISMLK